MKLVLTAPARGFDYLPPQGMTDMLFGWMWYNNIYIGKHGTDWTIQHNDFHKLYDLQLFEIPGNRGDPRGHWQKALDLLRQEGYEIKVSPHGTWRWLRADMQDTKKIDGIRIWITPKSS